MSHIFLSRSRTISCCFGFSADQLSSISRCSGVRDMASDPSAKNWDRVIPNPVHTFSRVCIVGVCFLRYQVEIVDCVNPAFWDNSYSDHPRCKRSRVISFSMSFISITRTWLLRILYFVKALIFSVLRRILNSL